MADQKKDRPKPVIDENICIGCSMCIENCPKGCLKLKLPEGRKNAQEIAALDQADTCIGCSICYNVCPADAIKMVLSDGTVVRPDDHDKEGIEMAKKAYINANRAFQASASLAFYALNFRTPNIIKGEGSSLKLPELLKKKGVNNVLFVTDKGLMDIGLPDPILEALDKAGIRYAVYSGVEPNPTDENIEEGLAIYLEKRCKGLVAMGGGSPMDCAKGIAARAVHPRMSVKMLMGLMRVHKKIPPFVAIPTTAGTGSETTIAAVITEADTHHKRTIMDTCLIPQYAILDPDLTVGLPPFITATTGLDALCHAVEAYTNKTYNTMLEDRYAKKAVRLVYQNLLNAYNDGSDKKARENMQEAAFYAGRAFTRGSVGYVHAIGHTLGGLYGVPHGLAMSIILPHVMRSYGQAVYSRLADLADICHLPGNNDKEKAMAFIKWIEQIKKEMNIPKGLNMIEDEDVDQIVEWAIKEANPLYPCPLVYDRKDLKKLVESMRE